MNRNIIIIDDEPNILKTMSLALKASGNSVFTFSGGEEAIGYLETHREPEGYAAAFVDLMMYPMNGMTVLQELRRRYPDLPIVIITAHATVDTAVEALKLGAFDYLAKPFDQHDLLSLLERITKLHEVRDLASGDAIITDNAEFRSLLKTAAKIAASDLTVLIEGETGTGKELLAEYIHKHSDRSDKQLIKLNCAALSQELIESELFGHVKGSFTSAIKDRVGLVEAANGGTLFLDEIGEMPMAMQAKMLRFLQNREYQRVGDNMTRKSDVRIVAATNRNLEDAISTGLFREDLFYRLSAFRLLVPPLRHRKEDIIALAQYFIARATQGKQPLELSEEAKKILMVYEWRGNIRELENMIVRACVLAAGEHMIVAAHLPEYMTRPPKTPLMSNATVSSELISLEELERRHITYVLSKTTSLEEAARILGIDNATLWRKRKKFGL